MLGVAPTIPSFRAVPSVEVEDSDVPCPVLSQHGHHTGSKKPCATSDTESIGHIGILLVVGGRMSRNDWISLSDGCWLSGERVGGFTSV